MISSAVLTSVCLCVCVVRHCEEDGTCRQRWCGYVDRSSRSDDYSTGAIPETLQLGDGTVLHDGAGQVDRVRPQSSERARCKCCGDGGCPRWPRSSIHDSTSRSRSRSSRSRWLWCFSERWWQGRCLVVEKYRVRCQRPGQWKRSSGGAFRAFDVPTAAIARFHVVWATVL